MMKLRILSARKGSGRRIVILLVLTQTIITAHVAICVVECDNFMYCMQFGYRSELSLLAAPVV